jgi:hypothetical protein
MFVLQALVFNHAGFTENCHQSGGNPWRFFFETI